MPLWHVVMAVIKSNVQKSSKDISYSLSNSPQNVEVFLEEFFHIFPQLKSKAEISL